MIWAAPTVMVGGGTKLRLGYKYEYVDGSGTNSSYGGGHLWSVGSVELPYIAALQSLVYLPSVRLRRHLPW